jgi:hypothetical protein
MKMERLPDDQRVNRKMMSPSMLLDMRESAKYFKSKHILKEIPDEPTLAMEEGTMFHMAILEPDKFKKTYIELDKEKYLTTVDQMKNKLTELGHVPVKGLKEKIVQQFEELGLGDLVLDSAVKRLEDQGMVTISPDKYRRVNRVLEEIAAHNWLGKALQGGFCEQPAWWEHESGLTFSMRMDYFNPSLGSINKRPVVIDIKTTSSVNPWRFERQIHDSGWHIAAYCYVEGIRKITGVVPDFVWAVVETKAPFRISTLCADDANLEQGKLDFEKLVKEYLTCLETNSWPDYTNGNVINVSLPSYAFSKNHDSFYEQY